MNNDFKVIDDTLYSGVAAEDIIQRRKSPVIALIVALAGSALAVWSLTSDTMVDRGNLSSMLMLVGGLIAIVGFIKAGVTFSSAAPVYKPTGERIRRYEIYYQAADKPALCAAVSSGDMERLVNIPRNAVCDRERFVLDGAGVAVRSPRFRAGYRRRAVFRRAGQTGGRTGLTAV